MLVEVEKLKKILVRNTLLKIMLCECFIMYRTAVNNNNNKKVMIKNGILHGHVTMYFCLKTFKSSFVIRVLPMSMLSQKEF